MLTLVPGLAPLMVPACHLPATMRNPSLWSMYFVVAALNDRTSFLGTSTVTGNLPRIVASVLLKPGTRFKWRRKQIENVSRNLSLTKDRRAPQRRELAALLQVAEGEGPLRHNEDPVKGTGTVAPGRVWRRQAESAEERPPLALYGSALSDSRQPSCPVSYLFSP